MIRLLPLLFALPLAAATYEDPAGRFHFDLPSGWTARVQGKLPEETPLTLAKGGFSCDLTVLAMETDGTIEEAVAELESALVGQGDVAREETQVDGEPAGRLTLTPDDASLGVTVMLVVVRDGTRLVVELRADRSDYRRDRAQFDAVLGGFHAGEPGGSEKVYEPHLGMKDDGNQLLPGNPPLTFREVSGCLGAVELAYGIELTEEEKGRLAEALVAAFREGEDASRQALVALSEQAWKARETAPDGVDAARKALGERIKTGSTKYHAEAARVASEAYDVGGKPSAHDMATVREWATFAACVLQGEEVAFAGDAWASWSHAPECVTDVEWMALRAAYSLASAADREAYRERLLATLGGTPEEAAAGLEEAKETDLPALGEKLREAAKPLIDTLSPPADLDDPAANGAIRYRF